jgi:hypothetical protein
VVECILKKMMLNRSRVFCGMGFNNLGFVAGGGVGVVVLLCCWVIIGRLEGDLNYVV